VARGVHGGLIGHEAITLDVVGDTRSPGHVRLAGERWLAATMEGHEIAPGCAVMVTAVRDTTLTVIANHEIEPPQHPGGTA
jgi:membrane-bound ClpP family serine protease